jgi:hypothetical protein
LEHKGQREWNRFLRIPRLRSEGWGRSKIIEKNRRRRRRRKRRGIRRRRKKKAD